MDATTLLVVGEGERPSEVRAGAGDSEDARAFRERCRTLDRSPVALPLGGGVCVRGAAPVAEAVGRALVVQLCLRFGPSQFALSGVELERYGLAGFPHAVSGRRAPFRLGVGGRDSGRTDADAVVLLLDPETEVPRGITTVIDVVDPARAEVRTADGVVVLRAEGLSRDQAVAVGASMVDRPDDRGGVPSAVAFADVAQTSSPGGLPAVLGFDTGGAVEVDIVADGPHAIVTGMTGTGKSELLVTWVAAIAAEHGPSRVAFVLADFKGGTAFDALRGLPQVAAVITDLDAAGARRGVSSLRAELRRREAVLAAAGVRDVRESDMPRLVIVVDEFAALLQEHQDLGEVFTDIAARGRALGMHLILGTQRATGVIRDALAANCPLRVSLRVADAADSRLVVGTADAADVPGGEESRGIAFVRRPQDAGPAGVRIARTSTSDLRDIELRWGGERRASSPWLASLPPLLSLEDVRRDAAPDAIVLGRADHPDRQEQRAEMLLVGAERGIAVVGAAGAGRTTVLRTIAAQSTGALWVPRDPEGAWDAVSALLDGEHQPPALVLCDDLDALCAELPADYAQEFVLRWERLLRGARSSTFVLTATRVSGPVGRLLDALPRRLLLRMPNRVEHVAAGGESAGFERERTAGRGVIGDHEVQIAWVPEDAASLGRPTSSRSGAPAETWYGTTSTEDWTPTAPLVALVTSGPHAAARRLAEAYPGCSVVLAPNESVDARRPTLVVGDADTWQRNWALWQRIRSSGEVLFRAESIAELRQLAGVRQLPPYASPHAGRVWSVRADETPRRRIISALGPR
ncbi:MAG: cell division protein FtsK [Microbacterium sp.]|nr:cell division protein FtsK [Microbacterium sp.]